MDIDYIIEKRYKLSKPPKKFKPYKPKTSPSNTKEKPIPYVGKEKSINHAMLNNPDQEINQLMNSFGIKKAPNEEYIKYFINDRFVGFIGLSRIDKVIYMSVIVKGGSNGSVFADIMIKHFFKNRLHRGHVDYIVWDFDRSNNRSTKVAMGSHFKKLKGEVLSSVQKNKGKSFYGIYRPV